MPSEPVSASQGFLPLGSGSYHDSNQDASAAPKRLVICCDGTWQSSVSGLKNIPSNVTRIARSVARSGKDEDGKTWQQVVYYDAGIGTGELAQDEQNRQGGFGVGFIGNVIEAYNFLVLNYNIGDEVFCFGFSRGAYTARAVAGLVTDIGIVCPKDLQDFPDLYALYQENPDGHHFRKSQAYRDWVNGIPEKQQANGGAQGLTKWKQPPHHDAPEASRVVKVVGVFDTVGSLGIPDLPWTRFNLKFLEKTMGIPDPGFHNISLSPCECCRTPFRQFPRLTVTQTFSMLSTHWLSTSTGGHSPLRSGTIHPRISARQSQQRTSSSSGRSGRRLTRTRAPARSSCKTPGPPLSTARCTSSSGITSRSCSRSGSRVCTSTLGEATTIS